MTRQSIARQLGRKSNAMSPLNWFASIVEIALVSGLILSNTTWVKITCATLVFAVIVFYAYVYCYYMRTDPNRLQTEEYNILSQQLTLLSNPTSTPPEVRLRPTAPMLADAPAESDARQQ